MATLSVKITGLADVVKKWNGIPDKVRSGVRAAMTRGAALIINELQTYPPQPDRMRSGHLNTYVRGIGSYPARAFGGNGKLKRGARTGKFGRVRFTSQQLARKWTISQSMNVKGFGIMIENTATYAPYVHSRDGVGVKKQTAFHKLTGWPTLEDVAEKHLPDIVTGVQRAIGDALK